MERGDDDAFPNKIGDFLGARPYQKGVVVGRYSNEALRYRSILSYEPFNFKGNLEDFPQTIAYGKQVDSLRRRYSEYLWNAEFRDTQEALVTASGRRFEDYSVFRRRDGKHAIVLVNTGDIPLTLSAALHGINHPRWMLVSPAVQEERLSSGVVTVPARSASILLEK